MARKAVQGFPEKSYYDNTRYLGIVATTDPLNEGLFKHMVNFDVSDTGQSVEPREGYLTTTLKNTIEGSPDFNKHISLSNKTIIYKDNTIGQYILFDLNNNTAYIAEISGYNDKITNYYLPIISKIANYDWNYLFTQVLIPQVSYVAAYRNTTTLANTITQFINKITPIEDTKIEHIYDENGISRALVKVTLNTGVNGQTPFNFILQLRYRQNQTSEGAADTLVVEGLPYMFEHPTLAPTERNLAVSKSIIPNVFQTLYTEQTRPVEGGVVSTLGNFIYTYDDNDQYVTNFILPNVNYNIKPYFVLNPAYLDLNNTPNISDKWAYRFEIFNTGKEIGDEVGDTIMSSPWLRYTPSVDNTQPNGPGTVLLDSDRSNSTSLGNADKQTNHYKGARYLIYVVSKNLNRTFSSKSVSSEGLVTQEFPSRNSNGTYKTGTGQESFTAITNRNNSWQSAINNIIDYKTLIEVIDGLSSNAFFYLYDIQTEVSTGRYETFDKLMQSSVNNDISDFEKMYHTFSKETQEDEYDFLLTGSELIAEIKRLNIFKTRDGVVFHLLPYAGNDTYVETNAINEFTSNSAFGTQAPYYAATESTIVEGGQTLVVLTGIEVNDIPLNTIVQVQSTGKMYQKIIQTQPELKAVWSELISYNPSVKPGTNTWGPLNSSNQGTTFKLNSLYLDERNNRYYRWTAASGYLGQLFAINNPGGTTEYYRFVFASLNYFNTPQDYLVRQNTFYFNDFNFNKFNWDTLKWEIGTDLTTLKTPVGSSFSTFTSNAVYGTAQPPWYASGTPAVLINDSNPTRYTITNAAENATIQAGTGTFYRQRKSPSGNEWEAISGTAFPANFVNNTIYRDLRTNFYYRWNNPTGLVGRFTPVSLNVPNLVSAGFFEKGINIIFYMRPYQESEYSGKNYQERQTLKAVWNATSLRQTVNLVYAQDAFSVTYIDKVLINEPLQIQTSNSLTVFEDSRLLVWNKNVLFISEEGKFYWFKERNRVEFAEEIVKVLQYKTIILVFTTQHLYAVYRVETITTQLNTTTNQIEQNVTGVAWLKQIVLYNLLVNKKYADVIQIFNQMVLFYSEDGQLFMIRPSNTIDSETRFSIQFLNKAANDILDHYDQYMNERLASYVSSMRVKKDEIKIKALVSINFIKIFYYVPGVITYILNYDVLNNRYYAYDTLTFTDVFDKRFIESGDLLITQTNSKLFFTVPFVEYNVRDNHVDLSFTNNFKKEGINCLIDTGNMNLNNHLFKRFRDLHVTFKNLNANNVLFNLETMIDEIVAKPFYNQQLEVIDSNNISYYVTVSKADNKDLIELVDVNMISNTATDVVKYSLTNNLFENNNMLMDFSDYSSSKLLTHRTSILGLGKVFRLKLQFISKGLYKLQNFGIIYKERRV
jgi:hypothetical protein